MAVISRVLALGLILLPSVLAQAAIAPAPGFATTKGTKFLLDGKTEGRFTGMNAFYLTKQPESTTEKADNVTDALTKMSEVSSPALALTADGCSQLTNLQ